MGKNEQRRRFIRPGALELDGEYAQTPELGARIQDYTGTGRYRTALDELLEILERKPGDQEALFLAAIVLSTSRTQQLTAAEPLSERYTYDGRLDPVWVVCCQCESTWVPSAVHLGFTRYASVQLMNPIGLQCQACGYTLCRDCLDKKKIGLGVAIYAHKCPHCQTEELTTPVRPTGRPPAQFVQRRQRITTVVLFREGPIPPDPDYMLAFFEARSPDILNDRPHIYPVAVGAWPESLEFYRIAYLMRLSEDGTVDREAIQTAEIGTIIDEHGARVHLVKLYEIRRPHGLHVIGR